MQVLILVGALNGLILPLALAVMLVAVHRRNIVGDYRRGADSVDGTAELVELKAAGKR